MTKRHAIGQRHVRQTRWRWCRTPDRIDPCQRVLLDVRGAGEDDRLVEFEHHKTHDRYDHGVEREEDDNYHEEVHPNHPLLDNQVAATRGAPDRTAHAYCGGQHSECEPGGTDWQDGVATCYHPHQRVVWLHLITPSPHQHPRGRAGAY